MDTGTTKKSASDYVRLHITPLNPAILPSIISKSILPVARNISFHEIPTFPEKAYGFVELPIMEAEKIKKKLNGAILKGMKVQIEDARPQKESQSTEEVELPVVGEKEKPKKRRRETETVPAVELTDRKVKRGWTDPEAPARSEKKQGKKEKKKNKEAVRSKYTSEPECLFRTTLPANVVTDASTEVKSDRKKGKKKETVIHEFSKTVKYATFLRDSIVPLASKGAAEYVEEKGWVNQDGEVIEGPVEKKRKIASNTSREEGSENSLQSSGEEEESSNEGSLADMEKALEAMPVKVSKKPLVDSDSTSSSGESSSHEDSEIESDSTPEETSRPVSSSGAPLGLTINIPKSGAEAIQKPAVHPLEALYKRRKPGADAPKVTNTPPSFNFFGADEDEDENERPSIVIPMTPFTQQDFQHRGLRSAAPTPDTAHPSRAAFISWPTDNDRNEANDDASPSSKKAEPHSVGASIASAPVGGDFEKWFYEKRGETNRGWKKAAKMASKEKRHSENKKRRVV